MKPDRFLVATLVVIGLLVLLSLGLFFVRQIGQGYGPEDTPQGVVRNYVLALEKEDYPRAYQMLSDVPGKPDYDRFLQAFLTHQLEPRSAAVVIQNSTETVDGVVVTLVLIQGDAGPLSEPYRQPTTAFLTRNRSGSWKIERLPYPFWGWDWYLTPAPVKPSP